MNILYYCNAIYLIIIIGLDWLSGVLLAIIKTSLFTHSNNKNGKNIYL